MSNMPLYMIATLLLLVRRHDFICLESCRQKPRSWLPRAVKIGVEKVDNITGDSQRSCAKQFFLKEVIL
jgi:hypothetical protein